MVTQKQKNSWTRGAFSAMLMAGLCASSASIVLPILKEHWALSYSLSGSLLALLSAGNIVASFVTGFLPSKIGERTTLLLLGSGSFLGYLLLAVTGNPVLLILGFALVGAAKGSTLNISTILVNRAQSNPTKYINMNHACFAAGSLLCPFFIAIFKNSGIWWLPMGALVVAGIIHWLCFVTAGLEQKPAEKKKGVSDWSFLKNRLFWMITGCLFCQNCAEIAITSWIVTYFKESGILTGFYSDLTVTVVWGSMLVVRLIIAFVLKIKDNFKALAVMAALSAVFYLLLLQASNGPAALGLLFLFGLAEGGFNPTLVASGGKLLTPESLGVMIPVGAIGAVLMPYVVGAVAEFAGITGGMLCPMVTLVGMGVFALLCRREQRKTSGSDHE